jgi:hypothetical protein
VSGDVDVVPGWEQWAQSEHGLTIDYKGFLWTGGNGQKDSRVLKFTLDGEFVMAIGNYAPYGTDGPGHDGGPSSDDTENLNKPTKAWVDPATETVVWLCLMLTLVNISGTGAHTVEFQTMTIPTMQHVEALTLPMIQKLRQSSLVGPHTVSPCL